MFRVIWAAVVAAIAVSLIAVTDAITKGVTGHGSLFTQGPLWVTRLTDAAHGALFALLATVLVILGEEIDGGSQLRRWTRRVLIVMLVLLSVPHLVGALLGVEQEPPGIVTVPVALAFLLSFPVCAALGAMLLRRPHLRVPAVVLVASPALMIVAFVLDSVGSTWAHPAFAEVALYMGVALLGLRVAATPRVEGSFSAHHGAGA